MPLNFDGRTLCSSNHLSVPIDMRHVSLQIYFLRVLLRKVSYIHNLQAYCSSLKTIGTGNSS